MNEFHSNVFITKPIEVQRNNLQLITSSLRGIVGVRYTVFNGSLVLNIVGSKPDASSGSGTTVPTPDEFTGARE